MSTSTLLNKERDFLELNQELEDKVKSLMIEVDTIISRQKDVMRPKYSSHSFKRNKKKRITQSTTESDEEYCSSTTTSPMDKSVKIISLNLH